MLSIKCGDFGNFHIIFGRSVYNQTKHNRNAGLRQGGLVPIDIYQ